MPETQAGTSGGSRAGSDPEETDILSRIVATKKQEVLRLADRGRELRGAAEGAPEVRDFSARLGAPDTLSVIAEVKRRSPGAGAIRPDLDPVELAGGYDQAGASAISVLTDAPYFGGSLEDLARIRRSVGCPILRKDFIIDEVQVWESRAAGADAILLIVRILDDAPLRELRLLAEGLGMTALVEVHDSGELDRALASGASVVGINNRDLSNFTTRIETTLGLLSDVPDSVVLVSESGISSREDIERLAAAGVDAALIGEALLRAHDPPAKVRELAGVARDRTARG